MRNKPSDKTLFAMDLTAKMAVEEIAQETNQPQEKVLLDFMKSNTAKMLYSSLSESIGFGLLAFWASSLSSSVVSLKNASWFLPRFLALYSAVSAALYMLS